MKTLNNVSTDALADAKRNARMLTVANAASLGIPLIELPILAHALGVESYGVLVLFHAIALTASTFVEYGFHYSGARAIAQATNHDQTRSKAVINILFAKLILYLITLLIVLPAYTLIFDTTVPHGRIVLCLLLAAYGFSPTWYFLGKGNLKIPLVTDLACRSIGLVLIIAFSRTPEDLGNVLFIQCSVGIFNSALPSLLMLRESKLAWPDFKIAIWQLRTGWNFFIFKGAASISSSITTTILGVTSTTLQVGMFAPSEKLIRSGTTFITTALSAFFPFSIQCIKAQGDAFKQQLIQPLTVLFCMMFLGACAISTLSKTIVELFFGDTFNSTVYLLQIMIFLMPFRIISTMLSILWLIPANHENISSRLAVGHVVFILCLGFAIAPATGAAGMVVVLALGEIGLFLATIYCTCKTSSNHTKNI